MTIKVSNLRCLEGFQLSCFLKKFYLFYLSILFIYFIFCICSDHSNVQLKKKIFKRSFTIKTKLLFTHYMIDKEQGEEKYNLSTLSSKQQPTFTKQIKSHT